MNLAIVGYGKMGRMIEQLAPEYGFEVKLRLDVNNNANYEGMTKENFRGIDAAVEFSTPTAALENIDRLARLGVNCVIGTTGWFGEIARAQEAVARAGTGLVWSPNFSVGVGIFPQLVAEAARLMARQPEYGAWAWEIHHATKKDAPSGTCLGHGRAHEAERLRPQDRRQQQPRGHRAGNTRNGFRFRGGYDHDPAHGAKPRRIRAWGIARGAMGGGEKGLFRFSRDRRRAGIDRRGGGDGNVYGMRHSAGDSVSERPVAR